MIAIAGFKGMTTSEEIRADAALKRLVDRGSDALLDVLGESAPLVDVRWDVGRDDRVGRFIEVRLRDATGEAAVRLPPGDFEDDPLLRLRLSSAWSTLLRAQSKICMREMKEAIRRLDALDACEG